MTEAVRQFGPNDDPADLFLMCWQLSHYSAKALEKGTPAVAKAHLEAALEGLQALQTKRPKWNPSIVKYRVGVVTAELAKVP